LKIKLDEHLPTSLADSLAALGHDAHTVARESLIGATDHRLWAACQTEGRLLITQDLDFSDIRRFRPGSHAGILVLRLAQPGRRNLSERVLRLFETEPVDGWVGCFVVATDRKLRVRRPSP
jgi:predicted nuclease of predicted toxin-antitoxin system